MVADAQVAKLMWEQKTLFPEGWVFGNQYYFFATPVVSALFFGLFGSSTFALGAASTAMGGMLLVCFAWMLRPFTKRDSLSAGVLAIGGAVILGVSICNCISGMQLLYTMASYYACYLIGMLLVVGVYLRQLHSLPVGKFPATAALTLSFALGMQSLRETLILILPLIAYHCLLLLKKERNRQATLFVIAASALNLAGVFCARFFPAKSNPMISGFSVPSSLANLLQGVREALWQFRGITGLQYFSYDLKWKPLFVLAVGICTTGVAALVLSVIKKQTENAAVKTLLHLSLLSLLAVAAVKVFLGFVVRTAYFFIWFLLCAASFTYLLEILPKVSQDGCLAFFCSAAAR